jgi:hypothetical protein
VSDSKGLQIVSVLGQVPELVPACMGMAYLNSPAHSCERTLACATFFSITRFTCRLALCETKLGCEVICP